MSASGSTHFVLTLKGTEELTARTYRLDLKLRNLLFQIQRGTATVEALLQNSLFPREEVVEKLRMLLKDQFVALGNGGAAAPAKAPGTITRAPPTLEINETLESAGPVTRSRGAASPFLTLHPEVSLSQARFVLCDFCLDVFGMTAQEIIDPINACTDVAALQHVLDRISMQLQRSAPDQVQSLAARVKEINDTRI